MQNKTIQKKIIRNEQLTSFRTLRELAWFPVRRVLFSPEDPGRRFLVLPTTTEAVSDAGDGERRLFFFVELGTSDENPGVLGNESLYCMEFEWFPELDAVQATAAAVARNSSAVE